MLQVLIISILLFVSNFHGVQGLHELGNETVHKHEEENNDSVKILPTLLQIFLTILLGWITGQFKIINKEQTKGLDIFVGRFALPVLIFSSLAKLDFGQVEWSFLLGIAVTKTLVFLVVFVVEYLLEPKPRNLSRKILRGLMMNPIVNMTILGVVANFALDKTLPETMEKFLGAIGNTFSSLAPFTLGLNMVGKLANLRGGSMKSILGLMVMKGLATPLLCHIIVEEIGIGLYGHPDPGLSNYAVLYGSIPPALGVDAYASFYNVNPELISGSIVMITFLSAPMMYMSAKILAVLNVNGESLLTDNLKEFLFEISVTSVVGVVFIILIFIVSKRFQQMPHMVTFSLLMFALECGLGGIIAVFAPINGDSVTKMVAIFLNHHGIYSGKICAPVLSVILYMKLKKKDKLLNRFKFILLLISPLLGALITSILLFCCKITDGAAKNFGNSQDIMDLILDIICLVIMFFFLAKSSRLDHNRRLFELEMTNGTQPERDVDEYTPQIFRHFLLVMIYCGSTFSNMMLNLFRICNFFDPKSEPGLYHVLIYVECVLWTGQGWILFAVFALDCTYILNPVANFFSMVREKLQGAEAIPMRPFLASAAVSLTPLFTPKFMRSSKVNLAGMAQTPETVKQSKF